MQEVGEGGLSSPSHTRPPKWMEPLGRDPCLAKAPGSFPESLLRDLVSKVQAPRGPN